MARYLQGIGKVEWICELCELNYKGRCRRCKQKRLIVKRVPPPFYCPECLKIVKAETAKRKRRREGGQPKKRTFKMSELERRINWEKAKAYRATPRGQLAVQRARENYKRKKNGHQQKVCTSNRQEGESATSCG